MNVSLVLNHHQMSRLLQGKTFNITFSADITRKESPLRKQVRAAAATVASEDAITSRYVRPVTFEISKESFPAFKREVQQFNRERGKKDKRTKFTVVSERGAHIRMRAKTMPHRVASIVQKHGKVLA